MDNSYCTESSKSVPSKYYSTLALSTPSGWTDVDVGVLLLMPVVTMLGLGGVAANQGYCSEKTASWQAKKHTPVLFLVY